MRTPLVLVLLSLIGSCSPPRLTVEQEAKIVMVFLQSQRIMVERDAPFAIQLRTQELQDIVFDQARAANLPVLEPSAYGVDTKVKVVFSQPVNPGDCWGEDVVELDYTVVGAGWPDRTAYLREKDGGERYVRSIRPW